MKEITLYLKPIPPFHLELTAWALRRHPNNKIDMWDGGYKRLFIIDENPIELSVTQTGALNHPELLVRALGEDLPNNAEGTIAAFLASLLGLNIDLTGFYKKAKDDAKLEPLIERFLGVKPPRFPTVFEGIVNGITFQQISLAAGFHFLYRLCQNYGLTLKGLGYPAFAFPRPKDLAFQKIEDIRALGYNMNKARALIELSRSIVDGDRNLEAVASMSDEEALQFLSEIRGVGRWTAEYTLLRSLGRINIYPGDDVGARNKLKRWLEIEETLNYESIRRILSKYDPFSGMIYFYLLLDQLARDGVIVAKPAEYLD
ncbi:MAG: DNA-3-methyladenine glycosylase family protein [Candidatus Aquicultor sp.]